MDEGYKTSIGVASEESDAPLLGTEGEGDMIAWRASSGSFSGCVMMDVFVLRLCTAFRNTANKNKSIT